MTSPLEIASPEAMVALGRRLAAALPPFAIVVLTGDLGAGKTMLAKGLAAGLGLASADEVTSPTYTLVHEYHAARRALYHLDLYRIDTAAQVATLGLDDLWAAPESGWAKTVIVEWGEKIAADLPRPYLWMRIEMSGDGRRVLSDWVADASEPE